MLCWFADIVLFIILISPWYRLPLYGSARRVIQETKVTVTEGKKYGVYSLSEDKNQPSQSAGISQITIKHDMRPCPKYRKSGVRYAISKIVSIRLPNKVVVSDKRKREVHKYPVRVKHSTAASTEDSRETMLQQLRSRPTGATLSYIEVIIPYTPGIPGIRWLT